MRTHVRGKPARHARKMLRGARIRLVAGAGAAAAGLTSAMLSESTAVTIAAFLLLAAGGATVQHNNVRQKQISAGVRSEARVAKVIERSGAAAVVHGGDVGRGGDADHIVLGPGVAVVETKTGRGHVRVTGGKLRAGKKTLPGDPVRQVRRQASGLAAIAQQAAHPIICIPDMTNPPQREGEVVICSLADLPRVLANLPDALRPGNAVGLAERIPLAS